MSAAGHAAVLARPGRIGTLELPNRLVRAATSETMATPDGAITPALEAFYRRLAEGGAGLIITGHTYVEPRGQYAPFQTGIDTEVKAEGWRRLVSGVHAAGGRIFAELAHAGSQSVVPGNTPVSPSVVPNAIFDTRPEELSPEGIEEIVEAFRAAAVRARAAGFDGIHIHGGNGYLISQFLSPLTNLRTDDWGGTPERRSRFLFEVYRAIREAVGADVPVTARIGMADAVPGGLALQESLDRVAALREMGLDGVEPVYAVMRSYHDNIRPYVAVGALRALQDWAFERIWKPRGDEAYYAPFGRAIKERCPDMPVILVGGLRTARAMESVIEAGRADFIAMARPMVREPDLPRKLLGGGAASAACVSCNMCLMHEGRHALQCWRTPRSRMWQHLRLHHFGGKA